MLHLQRSVPFVDSVFRIIDGETEYDESINLLIRAEQSSGIRIIIPALGGVRYMPEEKFSSLIEGNFYEFMDTTHLVLPVAWYDDLTILLPNDYAYAGTWRAYSNVLSSWANRLEWLGKKSWDYMDFYRGLNNSIVERYDEWSHTAAKIIELKQ